MFTMHNVNHVVVNKENGEERSYPHAYEARQRLVMLSDSGISAYTYKERLTNY